MYTVYEVWSLMVFYSCFPPCENQYVSPPPSLGVLRPQQEVQKIFKAQHPMDTDVIKAKVPQQSNLFNRTCSAADIRIVTCSCV